MAYTNPDEVASAAATDFARRAAARWRATVGADLLGIYLIGSLAHGGFSRRYSDIDIALITETGMSAEMLGHLREDAIALSVDWGPKLSLFWADRHFSKGRFPPLDRIDYLDRPVVLTESERVGPVRPDIESVRDYLRGTPFANWAANANRFAAAPALDVKDRKPYLRALLYPARFCFSYITGGMASNDDAAAFLRQQKIPGLDLESIERALECRHAATDPDWLFPLRTVLPGQVVSCSALIADAALTPRPRP
jgi:predicted nucleotidyltransferase